MSAPRGTVAWCHRNLFNGPFDTSVTVILLPCLAWLVLATGSWAIAADWSVIPDGLRVLMVGVFPADATWRAIVAAVILCALFGASLGALIPLRARGMVGLAAGIILAVGLAAARGRDDVPWVAAAALLAAGAWLLTARVAQARVTLAPAWVIGMAGVFAVLAPPGTEVWGGLLLSVLLTIVTSALSLPLGILLAFGRRSGIASVRILSTAYIEVMRSVPLILVVYWIWIVVPLLAPDRTVSDVIRGMVGFLAFFSAYVAEYVRSGLQAVPRGQTEAARSLGMGGWDVATSIVLPQALRVVVPALVGNVLDIFNAAPLVFIIGLTDFLRAGQMILSDPQHGTATYQVYAFLFLVYFAVGSVVTFGARRLEARLARGSR